jgi:uncharacterized protein YndB with AHSA1/START domain
MTSNMTFAAGAEREIEVTRVFDAPARLVFDAFTKPEMVKRWMLGPEGWTMPVCEMDVRAGGAYRWVWQKGDGGMRMSVSGEFREVVAPSRLVHTEQFDPPWYPGVAVITTRLAEHAGKTTLSLTMSYPSQEIRDGAMKSGMESGMAMSYARLERLLASAAASAAR